MESGVCFLRTGKEVHHGNRLNIDNPSIFDIPHIVFNEIRIFRSCKEQVLRSSACRGDLIYGRKSCGRDHNLQCCDDSLMCIIPCPAPGSFTHRKSVGSYDKYQNLDQEINGRPDHRHSRDCQCLICCFRFSCT